MKEGILGLVSSTGFIAVNKNLIKLFGTDAAILIGHFASLQNLHKTWFYNTATQIEEATGIKIFSIRKAVKTLKEAGVLQVDKRGIPAKLYYLLDEVKLIEIFFTQEFRKLKTVSKKTQNCSLENSKHINNKEKNKEKEYIKLHSLDKKSPKRLRRTKKKSSNIGEAKQSNPTKKELNDQYLLQATKLKDIVQAQKNININGQKLNNWCNSIRLLVTSEGVSIPRINKALRWYKENAGGDYVPVIESGQSLREKFTKLEAAIERSKRPIKQNNNQTNNWGTHAFSDYRMDYSVLETKDQDGNIINPGVPYDER